MAARRLPDISRGDFVEYDGQRWEVVSANHYGAINASGYQPVMLKLTRHQPGEPGKRGRTINEQVNRQRVTLIAKQAVLPGLELL